MTNNDRELIERAATAAGITICAITSKGVAQGMNGACHVQFWNPLADDGDALRLAAKLGMSLYINDKYCIAEILSDSESQPIHEKEYCDNGTKDAATRRAIVRAAAATVEP